MVGPLICPKAPGILLPNQRDCPTPVGGGLLLKGVDHLEGLLRGGRGSHNRVGGQLQLSTPGRLAETSMQQCAAQEARRRIDAGSVPSS